jgi:hypothetical protein
MELLFVKSFTNPGYCPNCIIIAYFIDLIVGFPLSGQGREAGSLA